MKRMGNRSEEFFWKSTPNAVVETLSERMQMMFKRWFKIPWEVNRIPLPHFNFNSIPFFASVVPLSALNFTPAYQSLENWEIAERTSGSALGSALSFPQCFRECCRGFSLFCSPHTNPLRALSGALLRAPSFLRAVALGALLGASLEVSFRAFFKGGDLDLGERHSRVTRDDGTVTLCALRAATMTVLSRNCRADFGRPLTKRRCCRTRVTVRVSRHPCAQTLYLSRRCGIPPPFRYHPPPLKKSLISVQPLCRNVSGILVV